MLINRAFHYSLFKDKHKIVRSIHFIKNLISRRFLCNSWRFAEISEEPDSDKSLAIIDFFCPLETTRYFRKLVFDGQMVPGIVANCDQLVDLTIGQMDDESVRYLPSTIQRLTLINGKFTKDIDLRSLENLFELTIKTKTNFNSTRNFPSSLEVLSIDQFSGFFEIDLLPKLVVLKLRNRMFGKDQGSIEIMGSRNHMLKHLTLDCFKVEKRSVFKNLLSFEASDRYNFVIVSACSQNTIEKLQVPADIFFDELIKPELVNFKNLRKLTISKNYTIPFLSRKAHLGRINFHDFFPNLDELEIDQEKLFYIELKYKIDKITCDHGYIHDEIDSEFYSLTYRINSEKLPVSIPLNRKIILSNAEITIITKNKKIIARINRGDVETTQNYARFDNDSLIIF